MPRNRLGLFVGPVSAVIALVCVGYSVSGIPRDYQGKPFRDQYHQSGPQVIPGTIQLALYDLGGEGVAYHDTDRRQAQSHLIHA